MKWEDSSVGYVFCKWMTLDSADYRMKWINWLSYHYADGHIPQGITRSMAYEMLREQDKTLAK